jgi:threonine aldolase
MIDLRSDTVTLPTDEMREAMRRAEVGDDSRDGDPTVRRLEEKAAAMTGKEAAMLVASGTMSNLVCLLAHAQEGGEVLLDPESHILRSEMGGIARLAGLFHRVVPAERGSLDVAALREMLSGRLLPSRLATAVVCVETTHNSAGGAVIPLASLRQVRAATAEHGVPVHIDGARLFNAAVALGVPAAEIARHGDSVGFCLSKALSAPVGSVVCGSAAFIERARAFRRMLGGAMRQAGVIAAAGIVALDTMVARLADDHSCARRIAEGLNALDPRLADPRKVESNIVMVDLAATGADAAAWVKVLAARGLRAGTWTRTQLRLVTHRHIGDADVDGAVAAFRAAHAELTRAPALARA